MSKRNLENITVADTYPQSTSFNDNQVLEQAAEIIAKNIYAVIYSIIQPLPNNT